MVKEIALDITPEEKEYLDRLRDYKTDDDIYYFLSFGETSFKAIFEYYMGIRTICECSYELQCAIFDESEEYYNMLLDNHYIIKMAKYRVDKHLEFVIYNGKGDFNV